MVFHWNIHFAIYIIIFIIIIYILSINETIREEIFGWMLKTPMEANAIFKDDNINGIITFKEDLQSKDIIVDISLKCNNISDGKYGLIIYNLGDISEGSNSLGEHFNPNSRLHGDINSGHIGDLGNIEINNGICKHIWRVKKIKIRCANSILGRGIVIHSKEDDLGSADNAESKKTGNIGEAISYALIGYSRV